MTLAAMRLFVLVACKPTPFTYQAFLGLQGTGLLLLCIPCVNWQRRAMQAKNSLRNQLLVDQFILSALQPGSVSIPDEPDQRCIMCLLRSLRQPLHDWMKGLLLGALPVPVLTILHSLPESLLAGEDDQTLVLTTV